MNMLFDELFEIDPDHPALNGSLTPPHNCSSIHNFSPGPTSLPSVVESIIRQRCFPSNRLGSMALSHRSPEFGSILSSAVSKLRRVMAIPDEYEVLFTQGGGHGQFAAIPLNLCSSVDCHATYVVSGTWSARAVDEAKKYCRPTVISNNQNNSTGDDKYFPLQEMIDNHHPDSKFIYLCSNETVNGIELHRLPIIPSTMPPLVVDASSDFTTKPISWRESNVGLLFACASKNVGHAGITVVIVRKDLISGDENRANPMTPGFMDYKVNIAAKNVWNTIPTFNVDVVGIMMEWMLDVGGVNVLEERSVQKANLVYGVIDESNGFYKTPLPKESGYRSRMNVPFCVANEMINSEEFTNLFLVECWKRGIVGLKTVTPFKQGKYLRVSLYHGVSMEDVLILTLFMKEFAAKYGGVESVSIKNIEEEMKELTVVEEEEHVSELKEVVSLAVSPFSSIVDLSRLSSSPTNVIDVTSLILPKDFKVRRYAKITNDMFAPPISTMHHHGVAESCPLSR
ncbi:hypothetical protein ACHAXN_008640 [Cyclotella atomus]